MYFFDKLYVGFQRECYNSTETPRLLGFCIPYNDTKANKKRQETVNSWRQKDIEPRILGNIPQSGFKLLGVVSRYSASNKLFCVLDPRGFELEISADNLLDLACQSTIAKGEIIEECVWAGSGSYLEPISSERYKFYMKQKIQTPKRFKSANVYTEFRLDSETKSAALEVINLNTKQFDESKTDERMLNWLVGQCMKALKGKEMPRNQRTYLGASK
jgi:hypothetical protein